MDRRSFLAWSALAPVSAVHGIVKPGEPYRQAAAARPSGTPVSTGLPVLDEILGGGPRERLITKVKDRPGHDRRYALDSSRIESVLGWKPAMSLEEGLRKTVKWYLGNKGWIEECTSGEYRKYYEKMYRDK